MPAAAWAVAEVGAAGLGDARRAARLATLVSDLAARPDVGIPAACATPAATKAADRWLANDAVTPEAILAAHITATAERSGGEAVLLAVQGTTALDFSAHPALAGAGPLAHPAHSGLVVQSVLAVSADGVPLGLLHQHSWARDPATTGARHTRRQRPTAAKESQRWLDGQAAIADVVPAAVPVLTGADREADVCDLFAQSRPSHHELLIRAAHNRRIGEETRQPWTAARAAPGGAVVPVAVGRGGARPPRHRAARAALPPVPVTAVLAEEPWPPPGEAPVCWLLLTTRPVAGGEAALACVRWYAQRWLVERFHDVLKSGCRIEALRLRTTARLERALALSATVAWRLLWLAHLARADPDQPCTVALTTVEWQVAHAATQRHAPLPSQSPPLGQAVRWIARLGGWLDRAGDGEPGAKVLWRGLRRLDDLVLGRRLAHGLPPAPPPPGVVGNA